LNNDDSELDLKDCCSGMRIDEVDFEVDVVARRGYQLFAFACTTTKTKKETKLKLFEVYVRARQLGGDEARIALVCSFPCAKLLQDELERDIDAEGRIKVFGQGSLDSLKPAIGRWIKEQSRI